MKKGQNCNKGKALAKRNCHKKAPNFLWAGLTLFGSVVETTVWQRARDRSWFCRPQMFRLVSIFAGVKPAATAVFS